MDKFISTGDFAKLAGITKRTLFHYDKIGLFSPRTITENGTRKYSKDQVTPIQLIKILQNAGISLNELKQKLKTSNYSYKRIYKAYLPQIQKYRGSLDGALKNLNESYSGPSQTIKKFEYIVFPQIEFWVTSLQSEIKQAFEIIDNMSDFFNNYPADPTFIIIFDQTPVYGTLKVGLLKEAKAYPNSKYINLFKEESTVQKKAYKRTQVMTKTKELQHLTEMHTLAKTLNDKVNSLIFIIHKRITEREKYIIETALIL